MSKVGVVAFSWASFGLLDFRTDATSRILLVQTAMKTSHRDPKTKFWKLPGGQKNPDKDSTPANTLIREILEELRIDIQCRPENAFLRWVVQKPERHGVVFFRINTLGIKLKNIQHGDRIEAIQLFTLNDIIRLASHGAIQRRHLRAVLFYRDRVLA